MRPHRPHRVRPVSSARPPRADLRAARFCMWAFSTNHPLVLLELRPADVAGVIVLQQHQPLRHRPAVTASLAGAAFLDGRALAMATERIPPISHASSSSYAAIGMWTRHAFCSRA